METVHLPEVNSPFTFDEAVLGYYISFDPNDPAFSGTKYFSVNNLDGDTPVAGWRPGYEVPPHSAEVVITVVEEDAVRHFVAYIMSSPDGGLQNGSRGSTKITAHRFELNSKYKPPVFHSNFEVDPISPLAGVYYDVSMKNSCKPFVNKGFKLPQNCIH